MKIYHLLAGLAACLAVAQLQAGQDLQLEAHLYVFKKSSLDDLHVEAEKTIRSGQSTVFLSPATISINQDQLTLAEGRFTWNKSTEGPRHFTSTADPIMPIPSGRPVTIVSSAPMQYLEKLPGGTYQAREIPGDSPDAPHCRMTLTVSTASRELTISCDLDIATIGSRETVPGLALPVGKPVLAHFKDKLNFSTQLENWSALLVPAPNDSDYSLLLLLKIAPVPPTLQAAPAPQGQPSLAKAGLFHLHTPRFGASAVAQGDCIYIIGGQNSGGILGDIERFDVRTHEIKSLTTRLIPRSHQGAALVDGKIYIFGGDGYGLPHRSTVESAMEIYDLATGAITYGADMPQERAKFATVVLDGKIYVLGGTSTDHVVKQSDRTDIYDPVTNNWAHGIPMPTARETSAAVVASGAIIVAGGHRSPVISSGSKTVEIFMPDKNQWFSLPDLAQTVSTNAAIALDGYIYLFGNYDPADRILAYNLRTHVTTELEERLLPASQATAVTLNGTIYVIGGTAGGGRNRNNMDAIDTIQAFVPAAR